MSDQKLPPGWDRDQIRQVISHYEDQTEAEQAEEIEETQEVENLTWMAVPTDRVPEIQALLARGPAA